MLSKLINNSNLDWISGSTIPKLHEENGNWISDNLILLFDDGFVVRGYYRKDVGWFGYNSDMTVEHYIISPDYYLKL